VNAVAGGFVAIVLLLLYAELVSEESAIVEGVNTVCCKAHTHLPS
jgi:hypothetical protein